ncbi:MAG: peptide chain release factor 1, partial [Holosporaceae bacterium]|nr:peptide chain release factor 1 [Holosporaceae bacterium]
KILRSRLYDLERQKLHSVRASNRRSQIGTGDRSERVRTYNYPQGRVSDHRIGLTLYKLPQIMEGMGLEEIIKSLIEFDQQEQIANFQEED